MPLPTIDLSGERFGRLTVVHRGEDCIRKNGCHRTTFVCKCDCGNIIQVRASELKNGNTRSCGCLHKEQVGNIHKTHGKTNTRLYSIWLRMRQRCNNPRTADYKRYGARGICICKEWESFQIFESWALANGYRDSLTIDRIDNDKHYSPDNCRWVTMDVQCNNKSSSRLLTFNGTTQTIAQWSKQLGIHHSTLQRRIDDLGWSVGKALSTPVKAKKRYSNGIR